MIENLKKILSREGGREYVQPSKEEKADFLLRVREPYRAYAGCRAPVSPRGNMAFRVHRCLPAQNGYPSNRELSRTWTNITNPTHCGHFS